MRYLSAFLVLGFILTLGTVSYAQTPDEMTPAEESVCDGLAGAAYGLCNAYCEAMDCGGGDTLASDEACDRVLDSYEHNTDVPMPCLADCGGQCGENQVCIGNNCCDARCRAVDFCDECTLLERCLDVDSVLSCCVTVCDAEN